MKTLNLKKFVYLGIIGVLSLAFATLASFAKANDDSPSLYTITQITKNSVVLPIKDDNFSNQTVTAIVSIKDQSTGVLVEKAMKVMLDDEGNGSIKVSGLKSATDYTFKVRIMTPSDSDKNKSTENSSSKDARTL